MLSHTVYKFDLNDNYKILLYFNKSVTKLKSVIFKEQGTSNNLVSLRSPECALYRHKTVACTVSEKYTEICCPYMRPQGLKRIRRSDLNSE